MQSVDPRVLGHLLNLFAHDLRSPLAAARANADFVSEEPGLGDDAREALDDAREALREAQRGLTHLGTVAKWLEGGLEASEEHSDLRALLLEVAGRHPVSVDVECPRGIACRGPELISIAVETLLVNARDCASSAEVGLRVVAGSELITIELVDDGPALSEELAEEAFEAHGQARLKGRPGGRYGRFAGLLVSRIAVEALGGSIAALGARSDARFRISLPTGTR